MEFLSNIVYCVASAGSKLFQSRATCTAQASDGAALGQN